MLLIPATKKLFTGSPAAISFELPAPYRVIWVKMVEKSRSGYWCVKVTRPRMPRTTGPESQCNAGNGYCQQIAIHTGNSFQAVKQYTKTIAIDRGYTFETMPDGTVMPISEADASTEDDYHWIKAIKQLADELGIKLKGDDGD